MPLIIPPGCAHVVHSITLDGDADPYAITYGVILDAGALPASPNALADALKTLIVTHMLARMPTPIHIRKTEVFWREGPITDPVSVVVNATVADGSNGETTLLPQNSAFLIQKRSALGGRRGRGRIYMPGVWQDACDNNGVVASTVATAYNTSLAAWLAGIAAHANIQGMAILHSDTPAAVEPIPTPVTTLQLDSVIATQRRRLRH